MKDQTFTLVFTGFLLTLFFSFSNDINAQEWAWMSGASEVDNVGVYGVQGVADAANIPGARNGNVGWVDNDDNIWMFGGFGYAGEPDNLSRLNDLWRFDPDSGLWTWVRGADFLNAPGNYGTMGVADDLNEPPARNRALNWTDHDGNFWLFGGLDYTNTRVNDLWKYDVTANQWTWMKGSNIAGSAAVGVFGTIGESNSANTPGARNGGFNWVDNNGDLWLFGGFGYASVDSIQAPLSDLWKFDVLTNNWTWMGGSDTNDMPSSPEYGAFRVPSPTNDPGARVSSVSWTDANGDLWLFGGLIGDFEGKGNDLWKYSVASGQWTWMDGDNIPDQPGQINLNDPAAPTDLDNPGARNGSMSWTDHNGNLWLFGGFGFPGYSPNSGFLSDTWMYNTSEQLWYFINGSLTEFGQQGVYGTQGVPDADNFPTSRVTGANMTDSNGGLWLHGGNFNGKYNDLWRLSGIVSGFDDLLHPVHELDLGIYPNPSDGTFNLEYREGAHYEILDAYGRLLTEGMLNSSNGHLQTTTIELQNLSPGTYFVKIRSGKKTGAKKFIVRNKVD